jgi:hypothetical protein
MNAVRHDNLEAVKRFVIMGADIDMCCDRGHRAICDAFQTYHSEMVILLLEQKRAQGIAAWRETIFERRCLFTDSKTCKTPLLFDAINFDMLPLIQYLVEKEGQDILGVPWMDGVMNPLPQHYAA